MNTVGAVNWLVEPAGMAVTAAAASAVDSFAVALDAVDSNDLPGKSVEYDGGGSISS